VGTGSKKKIDADFTLFFSDLASSAREREYFGAVKVLTQARLNRIRGIGNDTEIERLRQNVLKLIPITAFGGSAGAEVKMIAGFEEVCAMMSAHCNTNPKTMTVMEFYKLYSLIKRQQPKPGNGKSGKR